MLMLMRSLQSGTVRPCVWANTGGGGELRASEVRTLTSLALGEVGDESYRGNNVGRVAAEQSEPRLGVLETLNDGRVGSAAM
jgi:hypothetical protein